MIGDRRPFQREPDTGLLYWTIASVTVLVVTLWWRYEYLPKQRAEAAAVRAPVTQPAWRPAPAVLEPLDRPTTPSRHQPAAYAPPAPVEAAAPAAVTIYLCKSYAGSMFWSNAVCSTQRATIDRMATVPGHLSFQQQVAIAQGEAAAAQALFAPSTGPAAVGIARPFSETGSTALCRALEQRITQLDAMARHPQGGGTQDWIRKERMETRSRQAELRCA